MSDNPGAYLFYGAVIRDDGTLKRRLWNALTCIADLPHGKTEEEVFRAADTFDMFSAFASTHGCDGTYIRHQEFALVARGFAHCAVDLILPLGEMLAAYSYDPRIRDVRKAYRELFGETCVPAWHLTVLP